MPRDCTGAYGILRLDRGNMARPMKTDESITARMERLAEIEARIDPTLRRRGRVIADLVTVAVVAPVMIAFDLHVTRPLVMLGLMCGALALNHLVPMITERRLRRERSRLLSDVEARRPETRGGLR